MPILDVELVLSPGETPDFNLAARLADAAGEVLASRPHGTWVKLRFIEANLYAENGGMPEGIYPVFVTVLKSRVPARPELEVEIRRLTESIAQVCSRSAENVHILYQPEATGRVAFGGNIVSG
jgi:phenylpyruvate tautomerase PptA (4-oxalocrotonate tautomerase family)